MPYIDADSGEVIIRVVYDGASGVGKTANVEGLTKLVPASRQRSIATPQGAFDLPTTFFDWFEFSGGVLDGRKVRCQVLTVPGTAALGNRRAALLPTADAVVLVLDPRPDADGAAREAIERLKPTLGPEAGFVLQASVAGRPTTRSIEELTAAWAPPEGTPVVLADTTTSEGVMATFLSAVNIANQRARKLQSATDIEELPKEQASAAALQTWIETSEASTTVPAPARVDTMPYGVEGAKRYSSGTLRVPAPPRLPDIPSGDAFGGEPVLPNPQTLPSGHIWPPLGGRRHIETAMEGRTRPREQPRLWAPIGSGEIETTTGWLLHSSARWLFDAEPTARQELVAVARHLAALRPVLPDGRALCVTPERGQFRLWMVTPMLSSLGEDIRVVTDMALAKPPDQLGDSLSQWTRAALAALRRVATATTGVWDGDVGLDSVALQNGRPVLLSTPFHRGDVVTSFDGAIMQLRLRFAQLASTRPTLREWLDGPGRAPFKEARTSGR